MRILGLDEAGRGSVLGPMVVGGFLVGEDRLEELTATGVTDSKLLSAARREALIPQLAAIGEARVELVQPSEIDSGNITRLEMAVFATIIEAFEPDVVTIDAPVNPRGIPAFVASLQEKLRLRPRFVVEPKADLNYVWVGAASVFAKVRRDAEVAALGDVGSGYPSDPRTRALIEQLCRSGEPLPSWVRARWGTVREMNQQSLF